MNFRVDLHHYLLSSDKRLTLVTTRIHVHFITLAPIIQQNIFPNGNLM